MLLTIGAWWAKGLRIENGSDPRVVDGVEFLRDVNGGERPEMPARVIVVGAGDVAMDACRVARRLPGCEHVKVLYRRGPDEIPARKDELWGAIEEGIEFVYNVSRSRRTRTAAAWSLRCVRTELGEPGDDGRRVAIELEGSEHESPCGLVILATGQKAESEHLAGLGMMAGEKVHTDWDSMRTADPKVFAAGDGAFGPSTIVTAMYHGHRAAYYVKAFLEGVESPLPYRTPFKTRRVPVAQDALWEVFAREHQEFRGLGANPVAFPEIETDVRRRIRSPRGRALLPLRRRDRLGRLQRAHARGHLRDGADEAAGRPQAAGGLHAPAAVSTSTHFHPEVATLDDIVFLPANLSRLVIDPYRDACRVETELSDGLELGSPFLATGFDQAADEVRAAIGHALAAQGLAYVGGDRSATACPGSR